MENDAVLERGVVFVLAGVLEYTPDAILLDDAGPKRAPPEAGRHTNRGGTDWARDELIERHTAHTNGRADFVLIALTVALSASPPPPAGA